MSSAENFLHSDNEGWIPSNYLPLTLRSDIEIFLLWPTVPFLCLLENRPTHWVHLVSVPTSGAARLGKAEGLAASAASVSQPE